MSLWQGWNEFLLFESLVMINITSSVKHLASLKWAPGHKKTTSLIDILRAQVQQDNGVCPFDSLTIAAWKECQAHPLDWPSELYMISGPLPKKVLSTYLLMPESYLKGQSLFFFPSHLEITCQMPLIIVSCNPILIEIQTTQYTCFIWV